MAGLYIHIPFCRNKCAYCDFYSSPSGIRDMEYYIEAIGNEWNMRKNEIVSSPITTIYIGGGTPSLLSIDILKQLIDKLKLDIDILSLSEFTLEANPEDITYDNLKYYQDLGINRISVGIQSFNSRELLEIGRDHTPEASRKALHILSTYGFNYSADLMYGLPGQTSRDWLQNLSELLSYYPPHFSAYLLSYEPGTRLFARLLRGDVEETSENTAREMFEILCDAADGAGYHHYEISNLAKYGLEAKHNSSYWDYTPYIGLGPTAHSFDGTLRRFNPPGIKNYIRTIQAGIPTVKIDDETDINRFNDYIITSLRTDKGFDIGKANQLFDQSFIDKFLKPIPYLLRLGKLEASEYTDNNEIESLRIPRSEWLTSDAIMRELIL